MTMKFTTSRIENTISPITTSPPIRKPPNAATTWPAASGPSLPCDRISRVTATLSDRRRRVVSSKSVGKLEKSSGRLRNRATIRTSTEAVMESARPRSSRRVGSGRISTESSATTPMARPMSLPGVNWRRREVRPGREPGLAMASAMAAAPPPPNPLPQGEGEHDRSTPPPLAGGGWGEGTFWSALSPHAATPAAGRGTATPCAA